MYGLATIMMGLGMLAVHLIWPDMDLGNSVLIAVALFFPLAPAVVRYSRVVWMYFDRWAWPGEGGGLGSSTGIPL